MAGAVFAEVECRSPGGAELCKKHNAGQGGWPTIKSFTAATGLAGEPFPRTQGGSVCDEIASPGRLQAYVSGVVSLEGAGGAKDL